MKRVLIGGFISLIGSIWALAITFFAFNHLTTAWSAFPGRFLTTIFELGMAPYFVVSIVFLLLGIVLMAVEYFRKDP